MQSSHKTLVAAAVAGIAGAGLFVLCWFIWWSKPPQMGADGEAFAAVDALFTAVTARDERLLRQCEQRLDTCKDARKLPPEASAYLEGIIKTARAGQWRPAAERLYEFMQTQRREGAGSIAHRAEIQSTKSETDRKHE